MARRQHDDERQDETSLGEASRDEGNGSGAAGRDGGRDQQEDRGREEGRGTERGGDNGRGRDHGRGHDDGYGGEQEQDRAHDRDGSGGGDRDRGGRERRVPVGEAIRSAQDIVRSLAGRRPEAVSGVTRSDDGCWIVSLDVVELSRIPPSTDVLATFEVTIDADGELVDYARSRRFVRGQGDED